MDLKVVKFGGSSLSEAQQFKKVAEIVRAEASRRYVVPSAPGKRNDSDDKVTDLLYSCYDKVVRGEDMSEIFERIKQRYNDIIIGLSLNLSLELEFKKIESGFVNKAGRDYAASRGEYLNGIILACYLEYDFVDASEVIFFNEDGSFNADKTQVIMREALLKHKNAVIPGFYGVMPNDTIKTFSRGGSDITGSLVARAVDADLYENWTDIAGICMADPRIVPNPKTITTITYRELRELSYMGFSVLHEDATFPVRIAGIPIAIKNTNDPDAPGTMIVAYTKDLSSEHTITGVAGKKGFSVITLEKDMMNAELGFVKRTLEVLENHGISFEHLPSGIDTMSIVVNESSISSKKDTIFAQLHEKVDPDSIEFQSALSLIAVVGRGMIRTKGTAARVFDAIARAGINIRMIDQGSSELNIIIGVNDGDFENAIKAIYKEFVK